MNSVYGMIPVLLTSMFCIMIVSETMAVTDEALSAKQKGIIPIAVFTATGNIAKLEIALNEGLEAGLTVNEIKEILVHIYAYAGFPRALNGITTYMAVLEKRQEKGIHDKIGKEATPLPSDFDRSAYGNEVRNALIGRDLSKPSSGYPVFVPIIDRFLVEHLFADIFYRDELTRQERELATISILAAMSGTEAQLKTHLKICMNVGLSTAQLEDFLAVLRQKVGVESAERASATLGELLGTTPQVNRTSAVKVIKKGEPSQGAADYFTGHVTVESKFSSDVPNSYSGAVVNFDAGAHTAWHTHPLGQTLIVLSGRGLVQSDGQAVQEILPGDVVWIPKDVRHWHGAAPDSPMSHVAISDPSNGRTVEWMEPVKEEQYGK